MAVELKIPQSGESITEVQIGEWRKGEGDRVERDEIVVEIETDKASMELPAPAAGVLQRITHKQGDVVGVGEVIGYIEEGQPGKGDGRAQAGAPATRKGPTSAKGEAPAKGEVPAKRATPAQEGRAPAR